MQVMWGDARCQHLSWRTREVCSNVSMQRSAVHMLHQPVAKAEHMMGCTADAGSTADASEHRSACSANCRPTLTRQEITQPDFCCMT